MYTYKIIFRDEEWSSRGNAREAIKTNGNIIKLTDAMLVDFRLWPTILRTLEKINNSHKKTFCDICSGVIKAPHKIVPKIRFEQTLPHLMDKKKTSITKNVCNAKDRTELKRTSLRMCKEMISK